MSDITLNLNGLRPKLRPHAPAAWWFGAAVSALVLAGAVAGVVFQRHQTRPDRLEIALGPPAPGAALVRRPSRAVTVRLGRRGYTVALSGGGAVSLAAPRTRDGWSRFANGVSRGTGFGRETITVLPGRTEEFLTVSKHQGTRTWAWNLRTLGLRPTPDGAGGFVFGTPRTPSALRLAPVRILDEHGRVVTPAGAHWRLGRAQNNSWRLELRLDDAKLPLPYVIDPAVDYPSPLYLSSTASTETGSWRLVTSAPSGANTATKTIPNSGATGYFLFKPGVQNTASGTPSATPTGTGWVQDVAGGTGFPAGTWSFSVKTQIPSANLVAGTAILAIGIWKGTIKNNGSFQSKQTILAPTDDPAAQNIRSATSRTTTVALSVPAFNLAATDRLYVEVWRKQVGGISSATASDREVDLVANDGGSQIAHPPADDTLPVNAFSVATSTGGVYFTSPGGAAGTLYYRGSAAGSFRLGDAATDTGSGVQQVNYPAVTTAGWTHLADTITAGPTYTSSTYSWTAGATNSPGAQAVAAQDSALNASTGSPITITNDTTGPTALSVALTSPPAWYTTPSVALTPTDGTDAGAGIDTSSRVYQRDEVPLNAGTCGTFPNTWSTTVSNPDTTVQSGKCYRYRLLESDRVGNQSAPSTASGTAKVDSQGPTQPSLAFTGTNASATGSTVYYRSSVSGSFTVTASGSTDAESGLSSYAFPTPATWTVTGTGVSRTYAWTPTSTQTGTLGVHGVDAAGNTGPDASFTPTPDASPPTTTDNSATVGSGWKTSAATVTLTPADALSGVAATYYTTDGSTPTTSSPQGTTVTLAADGVYTIKYFSVDNVGNAEAVRTASTQIRVDATAPTVTMGTLPAAIHSGQPLTASASDAGSGIASVAYYYCSPSPCTPNTLIGSSATGPSYSFTWTTQPPDGTYDVLARATDNAANPTDSAKQTVQIGNAPPDTTITIHPPDPSNDPAPIFWFTSTDPVATFECKLDAAAYAACSSPTTLNSLADGPHTFSVRSINGIGTDPTPASWSWTKDTIAPDTSITSQPANPSTSTSASFSFTSTETGSSFQCQLDGGTYSTCTSPSTLTGLLEGSHTFSVRAADPAGNTDATPATFTWVVDTGPPDTTITSQPTNPSANSSPSFSFTSSEAGSTFQCRLDGGTFATCTSPKALTGLADGSHTFTVRAVDAVGNLDPTPASYTWTVDTTPPDTTITAQPANPSTVASATFSFTSTEAGSSFQCQLDGATYAACTSPQAYSGLANGTHTFAVRATDSLGNTDATPAMFSWIVNVPFVAVDEVHYTFTGPTSVAFDWRGTATDIRYGPTTEYGSTATAHTPSPLPFSSAGPFREADLTGLSPGATYHYSIGGGADATFTTEPTGSYTFDVIADVGAASHYPALPAVHGQVAADNPAFVLVPGDITYADPNGQSVVDEHFNDVMTWSQTAAYMPAWGNHEWQTPTSDDLRNYKGRFEIPNAGTSPDAPSAGCCGEDWGWFDAGPVRFISYPDRYSSTTWPTWQTQVDPIFAAAQNDPSIQFIVTFGHRPAYSTGLHPGDIALANALGNFGNRYPKYVLNINGHSHDYERYQPISGVTHITTGGAGSLEAPWQTTDSRTAVRAMHLEHLRVEVSSTGMRVEAICGPATPSDDITCDQGSLLDSYTIGSNPPPPPTLGAVLYVDNTNPFCSNTGGGSATQPFCTISAAAARVSAGQTVEVGGTTYPEMVNIGASGTATAPIIFTAAPGASPTVMGAADGFVVQGQSYVTITGFNVTDTTGDGIAIKNSAHVVVSGNHVSYNGQPVLNETARGIRFETVTNSIVENNTVDHNTAYGIYIDVGSTGNMIRGNNCFANAFGYQRAASGIRIHTSSNNTISSNWSHDNEDSGMDLDKSTDNLVVDNLFTNNGDHGVDVTATSFRTTVTGNTVYKSVTAGINVEGTSTATISNNVSVDNGIASPRTHSDIRVDVGSTSGTSVDYDEVYLTTPDMLFVWGSSSYSSLQAFQAATGQELHGIQADPKWANSAGNDFHLTANSPAIDSANSDAPGQTVVDNEGFARMDDPVTVDTGAGVRSYDDRGAFEYHAPALDHLAVSPANATLTAGGSRSFSAEGYDAAGNDIGNVTASSTFSIGPDGSCTGTSCTATTAGPHTVTATVAGVTGSTSLTVAPAALHHLVLSPAAATIISGGTVSYSADGRDQYNNSTGDVTATTTFTIGPNGSCTGATCTASTAGSHTVTGTKSGKTGTASLQVLAGSSHHIVISPANTTITAGGTRAYTAQSFDSGGNLIGDVTSSTSFSIAPDGSCSANTCTASKVGAHTVTGINSGQTSTGSLTVTAGPLDHLALTPAAATIAAGGAQAYSAQGRDAYDNPLGDLTSSTTFTIAPDGSCAGGTCTATLAGPHTVTGSSGAAGGTASLQVTAGATIARIVISPATASVAAGAAQTYTAQGYDAADNAIGDVTASTSFSLGPDGSCTGNTCTATTAGAHTVTGTAGTATNSATLTVTAGALDQIVLTPGSATISAGGSETYSAEGRDQYNNTLGDITQDVTFTIAPNGSCSGNTCTASSAGTHTVTASEFGKTGSASLQVTGGNLDHIVLSPGAATISAGGSQTYSVEGFDTSGNSLGDFTLATTLTISPDGSCSGNTCTATVVGDHTVTAINNGKTSSAVLTVQPGALDHLVLSPASATIVPGGSQTYIANGRDQYDNWLGDQNAITTFTIAPDGSCTGTTCTASVNGAHTVTATVGEITGTTTLQVTPAAAIHHIVISPSSATIAAGDSQTYTSEAFDSSSNSLGDVTGSTSFTIGPNGSCSANVCTATTAGAHTVTGTAVGKTSSASLSVTAGPLDHLVLSPASAVVAPGASQTYTAEGRDQFNNSLGDVTASTTFTIGPDGSCIVASCSAAVNGAHTVTGNSVGATGTATLTVSSAAVDHIVVSPGSASISAGGSQSYTAQAFDASNNSLGDVTGSTTFTIAPNGSCSGATCTATQAGAHTVTGSSGGKTSNATLNVTAGPLHHLALSPASATISPGGSQAYTAQGRDQYDNSLGDVTAGTTFTIAPNGSCTGATCTASTAGAHTVTGTNAGKTGTATLQVASGTLDHIVISPSPATITAGGSQTYTAQGFDASNNSLGDVTANTTFTIGPNGSCTGATCTATVAGAHTVTGTDAGKTSSATLTVNAGPLDHLALSPASATISAGGSQAYTAQGRDQYENSRGDVTAGTTFTIGPDGSCAGATCTATTAGAHTVTGTTAGKTGTASLQVNPAALDHLVLSPASATIIAGTSQAYTAQGRDQYENSRGDVTAGTTFTIAPDGSCTGPSCTATAAGAHTVTGTNAGKTGIATLTINAAAVDHIVVSPGSASISAGGSQSYTAQAFDASNNSLGDVTGSTTFTIAPNGSCSGATCTATQAGAHTVTGSSGGKTSNATLNVTAGPLHHLALSPASATISPGGSQAYTAQGRDQYDNSLGDVTAGTTFTIAPNGSCTGATCTASTAGAHTVTGTNAGKTGTASLQVTGGTLDHIVISPASATITAGGSQAYTAQGFDASNNSLGDVTASTTFTVLPDGSCTGATCTATVAGSHTVTGTDTGKTSSATLTVNAGPLDHLALSPASAAITAGGSQAYTAQGRDQYNNPLGNMTSSTTFTIGPDGSCTATVCSATTTGAHTVTGTAIGATGTASLQVSPGSLDHITISPATATIANGGSQAYTAQSFDVSNNLIADVTANTVFTIAPDGSCTGATCTATLGGNHTVTGTNAGKTATAKLSVDYVKNPGFEASVTGWNTSGSGANITLTRVAGGHSGGWAGVLTNTGTTASTFATLQDSPNWVTPTAAGTYTGSIWVRADTAGAVFKLKFQEFNGTTLVGSASAQKTLSTSWQQVTVTYTVSSPGTTLDFQGFVQNALPGPVFYADDLGIVLG